MCRAGFHGRRVAGSFGRIEDGEIGRTGSDQCGASQRGCSGGGGQTALVGIFQPGSGYEGDTACLE